SCFQEFFYLGEGPRSVADPIFLIRRELRQGLADLRHKKHRVISKSLAPRWFFSNQPFEYSLSDFHLGRGPGNRRDRDETRAAPVPRHSMKFSEQLAPVVLVSCIRPGVAGCMHAWASAQSFH